MFRFPDTARLAAARKVRSRSGQFQHRSRFEPLESRRLLTATVVSVDTFDDVIDPGDGVTSLREAILAANASPDDYLIQLPAGTYALTRQGAGEDAALTGDLDILNSGSLRIVGAGAATTTIDGAGLAGGLDSDGIFSIHGAMFQLQDVTLAQGSAYHGGALSNDGGSVEILDCVLTENSATYGAAAYNQGGQMSFFGSTISDSVAYGAGAVYNEADAQLTLINTQVVDSVGYPGLMPPAGGIANSGQTTLIGSAVLRSIGAGIYNAEGQLTVTDSTISENENGGIYGGGAAQLTLTGSTVADNMLFGVDHDGTVTILSSMISGNDGTGVSNDEELTIIGSTISGNAGDGVRSDGEATILSTLVEDNAGTGLLNYGQLTLLHSRVSGNSRGGIDNHLATTVPPPTATIIDSTIAENTRNSGSMVNGGGIRNRGSMIVRGSTISGNSAHGDGGGIYNSGQLSITSSTVSGNAADKRGGGFFGGGQLTLSTLSHSTITGNRALADDGGGGLYVAADTDAVLDHTIVAGNFVGFETHTDVETDPGVTLDPASSYSLIGDPKTAGGLVHGTLGNIVGDGAGHVLPAIGILEPQLADNGGPTLTHALTVGSPAINAGDPAFDPNSFDPALNDDQRGPGFSRVNEGRIDIGAYESTPNAPPIGGVIVVDVFTDSLAADGLWSLREAVIYANTHPGDFEIQLAAGTYLLTIASVQGAGQITGDLDVLDNGGLRIVGAGAEATTIDASAIQDRIFGIHDATFHLEAVTLTGGFQLFGGAIANYGGNVAINDSKLTGNTGGGAIYNVGGQLALHGTAVSHNLSLGIDSGIVLIESGEVTLIDSQIADNADRPGNFPENAGIRTLGDDALITVIDSTIANNPGAGINARGMVTVIGSTISGNEAGGITAVKLTMTESVVSDNFQFGVSASNASITSSTISGTTYDPFWGGSGRGLYIYGMLSVIDTTITGNVGMGLQTTYEATVVDTLVADNGDDGVFNTGQLTLLHSTVSGNLGHGIFNRDADSFATIIDSTISDNHATGNGMSGDGGGIYNSSGHVSLTDTTVADNTAQRNGGGIYKSRAATLSINSSTISGNTAGASGGGIYNAQIINEFPTAILTIANSTVSGNSANQSGGGIYNAGNLTVRHTTITGNRANADNSGSDSGGGIYLTSIETSPDTGTAALDHTIVAGNLRGTTLGGTPSDVEAQPGFEPAPSSAYNLIGDPNTAGGLVHGTLGNIVGDGMGNVLPVGLVLDTTLVDNGGPTLTHALVPGSPAINHGDPGFLPPPIFDQRGAGFPRVLGGTIDIGAYESEAADAATGVVARRIFYNNCTFDGYTPGASPADGAAIAVDKTGYLPGSGPITPASATSYSKGINGVIIELAAQHGPLTAADFTFRMSEPLALANNLPASWSAAPTPSVTVFSDSPSIGTDRIVLIWPDGAIVDRYLQVTLNGFDAAGGFNANTGLSASDMFYVANKVGDTMGDYNGVFLTDATDEVGARTHQSLALSTTNPYDFNRDGIVDATDQIIARGGGGFLLGISVPSPAPRDEVVEASAVASALASGNPEPVPDGSRAGPPDASLVGGTRPTALQRSEVASCVAIDNTPALAADLAFATWGDVDPLGDPADDGGAGDVLDLIRG